MVASSGSMSGGWSSVLSPREREVAGLAARSLKIKEMARQLGLTNGTVKIHVHSIILKLRAQKFGIPGARAQDMLIHLMDDS